MAFNPLPPSWIPDISDNGTNVTIPLASIPGLTADKLDPATGDIRKVLFAVCEKLWADWNALASADRPTKMTINKSAVSNVSSGTVTNTYTLTFVTAVTAQDVVAES